MMRVITSVLAGSLCVLACARVSGEQTMNADALGGKLGVHLPNGTRVVGVISNDEGDGLIRAKLEMPATQVPAFLTSANVQNLEEAGPDLLGPDEWFWDPHRAASLRSGEVQMPNARFLLVALDQSRADKAVIYVIAHGT